MQRLDVVHIEHDLIETGIDRLSELRLQVAGPDCADNSSRIIMRLLSFLNEIDRALLAESPVVDGGAWESTRMVNFHTNLARLSLKSRPEAELPVAAGTIFLQSFALADGSLCLKATINWKDSEAQSVIPVYGVPSLNWKLAASRIASIFLEGPPAAGTITTLHTEAEAPMESLAAVAG